MVIPLLLWHIPSRAHQYPALNVFVHRRSQKSARGGVVAALPPVSLVSQTSSAPAS